MILSGKTLRKIKPVEPFVERSVQNGKSYGVSVAGYDIRVDHGVSLDPRCFILAASLEHFDMPGNVVGRVHDKSSWARQGLSVFNTIIEPGWRGYLTLELFNAGDDVIRIEMGDPIAQIIFEYTDQTTEGYTGKYQDQERGPQKARYENALH